MKKILSVVTIGVVYVLFLFSFSFLDSIRFIDKTLSFLGLKNATTQSIDFSAPTGSDPVPEPPIPPPPPPGGFQ